MAFTPEMDDAFDRPGTRHPRVLVRAATVMDGDFVCGDDVKANDANATATSGLIRLRKVLFARPPESVLLKQTGVAR